MKDEHMARLFNEAIATLQEYEPPEGYYVAFSGGKDSIVILDLVKRSGVKYDAHMNITSVDPPELTAFVKHHYPDVERHRPKLTMFQLIEKNHMMPSSRIRFCCKVLKEGGGHNRTVITGIRKAESFNRSKRTMFEINKADKTKKFVHIIIDWKESDVWDYIKMLNLPYPNLYDNGWKRIGCIGCPMASVKERRRQFSIYPNYEKAYKNSLRKSLLEKPSQYFGTDYELFWEWWMSGMSIANFNGKREQTELNME